MGVRAAGATPWWRRAASILQWLMAVSLPTTVGGLSVALGQEPRYASGADIGGSNAARARADNARGFRLVISVVDRRLWAILGGDTLLTAPVAVAVGNRLEYQGKEWFFMTPRGRRTVVAKDSVPVWTPPEWHYYEVARARGLIVRPLTTSQPVVFDDGQRLEIRAGTVGVVGADSTFTPVPADDEIIFAGVLYIPPLGTRNRQVDGALGSHRLDLGGGYLLHGTAADTEDSIAELSTHGCIRLRSRDIAWLYEFVPVGTAVYIY